MPGITNAYACRFKDLDLSASLVSWNDRIGVRLAVHQYVKRNGADVEPMGFEPGRFTMRFCFLGSRWAEQYRALVSSVRDDPKGVLVHPLLGSLRVACEGVVDGSSNPATALDTVDVTLSFVEDATDTTVALSAFPRPVDTLAALRAYSEQLSRVASDFQGAAPQVSALASKVASLASLVSAVIAQPSAVASAQLSQALEATATATATARSALLSTTTPPAAAYDGLRVVEQAYAAATAAVNAAAASRPSVVTYVVTSTTNIAALTATLYGADALAHVDEVLGLNPGIQPHRIVAGTSLRVARPSP